MYSPLLNVIFVHVPKCAGTSIIEAIRKIDPKAQHGHVKWKDHPQTKQPFIPHSFTVVRNPWDRVFSCYNYARKDESFWHSSTGSNKHPDYEITNKYSFKDVVKMLYYNRELLDKPHNLRPNFKHNWDHQHPYIVDRVGTIRIDNVFRYENLEECQIFLRGLAGIEIPHLNSSNEGLSYKDAYDDETIGLVSEVYAKDIELLGYKYE